MYIETDRLIIRDFCLNDTDDLQEILGDDETMKFCEPPYSIEQTEQFLKNFCIERKGAAAAVLKKTNKVIGYILFNPSEQDIYEIGWFFNKKYWGNGYTYEACSEIIKVAFDELGAHKIFAETIDTVKSVNLMKKLGMSLEGVQRSHTKDYLNNWTDIYLYGIINNNN